MYPAEEERLNEIGNQAVTSFTEDGAHETMSGMVTCAEFTPHWWHWHPPVGVFIAILALLGVIVPWLFREPGEMQHREKAIWTLIMFVLFGLELRTLYLDRNEHDREQALANCRQLKSFQDVADALRTSLAQSQSQYQSTVRHVDEVLVNTQRVSSLARKNLANLTGGNSFALVYPTTPSEGDPLITLNVHNYGSQILTGVIVTMYGLPDGPMASGPYRSQSALPATNIGTLAPKDGRMIPEGVFRPLVGTDGVAHYLIYVNSQTSGVHEEVDFRPSRSGTSWAWKMVASTKVNGTPKKGDVFVKKEHTWIHYLKRVDWTEPVAPWPKR